MKAARNRIMNQAVNAAGEVGNRIHTVLAKYDSQRVFTAEELADDWRALGISGDVPTTRAVMRDALFNALRGPDGPGQVWREAREGLYRLWANTQAGFQQSFGARLNPRVLQGVEDA